MAQTMELARFTIKPDEEEQFLTEREAATLAAKENFEGFLGETLVKLEDGSYLSIWTWEQRADCDRAMGQVEQVPAVGSWLAHIDQDISMEFGTVV